MNLPLGDKRILLCNDDGIEAAGFELLIEIARKLSNDLWMVAPLSDQSGQSRSMTLHRPLRIRQWGKRKFGVDGTPTDCIMLALQHIMSEKKPDLILSGVNRGHNIAQDVCYSGTIAAAMEGTSMNIASIALSQHFDSNPYGTGDFGKIAKTYAPEIIHELFTVLDRNMKTRRVLFNVNFPDIEPEELGGVEIVRQGDWGEPKIRVIARDDPRGGQYYWLAHHQAETRPTIAGTDLHSIAAKKISITPLQLNLTDYDLLAALAQSFAIKTIGQRDNSARKEKKQINA